MFVISLVNLLFCEIVGDKGKYSKTIYICDFKTAGMAITCEYLTQNKTCKALRIRLTEEHTSTYCCKDFVECPRYKFAKNKKVQ